MSSIALIGINGTIIVQGNDSNDNLLFHIPQKAFMAKKAMAKKIKKIELQRRDWSSAEAMLGKALADFKTYVGQSILEKGTNYAILWFFKQHYADEGTWLQLGEMTQIEKSRFEIIRNGGKISPIELVKLCVCFNVPEEIIYLVFLMTGNALFLDNDEINEANDILSKMFELQESDEDWTDKLPLERLKILELYITYYKYR